MAFERWLRTVPLERNKRRAISSRSAPRSVAARTWRSRSVSGLTPSLSAEAARTGIDHMFTTCCPPDRHGELLRRRVLQEESVHTGLHRTPQIPRLAKGGQHQGPALRQRLAQGSRTILSDSWPSTSWIAANRVTRP